MAEQQILYVPPNEHYHNADVSGEYIEALGRRSVYPRCGTVAVCECGIVIVYRGSPGGLVAWWPETWWERRKRFKRERKG